MRHLLLLVVAAYTPCLAQTGGMNGSWLEYKDLHIAIAPDSSGIFFFMQVGGSLSADRRNRDFYGTFDPVRTTRWIEGARGFLRQRLANDDTGTVRTSPVLKLLNDTQLYVARRKNKGKWTSEQFIVFETPGGLDPIILNGGRDIIGEMLDSLEAVAMRTPYSPAVAQSDSIPLFNFFDRFTKPVVPSPRNLPPPYPEDERKQNHEGAVVLSFIVGVDGRADMRSVKVLYARSPDFLRAVQNSLESFRFTPAERNGVPAPMRVMMPFSFKLRR